jgi:hypothetical protein
LAGVATILTGRPYDKYITIKTGVFKMKIMIFSVTISGHKGDFLLTD